MAAERGEENKVDVHIGVDGKTGEEDAVYSRPVSAASMLTEEDPKTDAETSMQLRTEHEPEPDPDANANEVTDPLVQKRAQRHSKRLSLNFPVSVPLRSRTMPTSYSASPTSTSAHHLQGNYFSPPQVLSTGHYASAPHTTTRPMPPTPPSEGSDDHLSRGDGSHQPPMRTARHGRSHTLAASQIYQTSSSVDFLTLLASQERRVLELKEELSRAESELLALKKQWAIHEASRKKGELQKGGSVKMTDMAPAASVSSSSVTPAPTTTSPRSAGAVHSRAKSVAFGPGMVGLGLDTIGEPGEETESDVTENQQTARAKSSRRGTMEGSGMTGGKRTGQRVFSGSRHTRALSLLTTRNIDPSIGPHTSLERSITHSAREPLSPKPKTAPDSPGPASVPFDNITPLSAWSSHKALRTPSSRAQEQTPVNFGKTYQNLAQSASKASIPTNLAKQGKVVVDGVRDGLWSFFEDIRQATIGEEATPAPSLPRQNTAKKRASGMRLVKSKAGGNTGTNADIVGIGGPTKSLADESLSQKDAGERSFWSEFGVDTPRGADQAKKVDVNKSPESTKAKAKAKSPLRLDDEADTTPSRPRGHPPRSSSLRSVGATPSLTPTSTVDEDKYEQTVLAKSPARSDHGSKDSKDSTDSRNPPSLLDDLLGDVGDEEDGWDWGETESPISVRQRGVHAEAYAQEKRKNTIAWPELTS